MYLLFYGTVRNGFEECNIITRGIGRGGPKNIVTMLHSSKPLSISAIGSFIYPGAVVYCCCVLLSVVVCCCVLLCVRGVGRSPCSCVVWAGIQGVGVGWQGAPSPSHYSVGIHGCLLVGGGGGGCYSYIRFDPSLAVSWKHTLLTVEISPLERWQLCT